jgi:hypothetical protein
MREFKDSITGKHKAEEEDEEEEVAAITSPAVTTPTVEPTATVAPPESKPLS